MVNTKADHVPDPAPSAAPPEYPPIADYAFIGNCRTAALVSRGGSIDWLCVPRFDRPSVFAALLDARRGGRFLIRPVHPDGLAGDVPTDSHRRYIGRSNVLETTFKTPAGTLRLTDAIPVASEEDKKRSLWPDLEIIRHVHCLSGQVEVEAICDPRPAYGRIRPRVRDAGTLGFVFHDPCQSLLLRSEARLSPLDGGGVGGRFVLRGGQSVHLSLAYSAEEPAVLPALGEEASRRIQGSIRWWEDWASKCRYEGPYRDLVVRSALALKLMTFAPSGAVIAAPTTSLPEHVGGVRNWDYRYCWLRDASMTLRALLELGYPDEGHAFAAWILQATRLTAPEIRVLYDVYGEINVPESTLEHLEGYMGSRPVRIGNGAKDQLQLDVYGAVVDAAFRFVSQSGTLDRTSGRMLRDLGLTVCRRWREPDEGIWEPRSGRRHNTFSKAMCWVALDRLLRLHEHNHLTVPVDRFARERDAIRAEVDGRGFNPVLGSYTATLDGDDVDASLLELGLYGYEDPRSPRMIGTCRLIYQRLGAATPNADPASSHLLCRYIDQNDGLPGGEGAFGICCFWGVEALARAGYVDEATDKFERLCTHANDVGLLSEEIDPRTGALLGNIPQAFTHVGLINAARTLADIRSAGRRSPPRGILAGGRRA
jgi:GH15 family glucan-1,4-alpha-glucosidase